MKNALHVVTGGTGFIGSALVLRLVDKGFKVRVLDNNSRGQDKNLETVKGKIESISCDIRNPKEVTDALKGAETVWHLAAVNGTENFYKKPGTVLEVGVKGIVNILDACKATKVSNLFVASSSEVYQTPPRIPTNEEAALVIPDPKNARYSYGASKLISEMMALHCDKEVAQRIVIVRPHNVYGPAMGWEHVVPQLIKKMVLLLKANNSKISLPIQGTGQETRAFCYISDMIDGLMSLYENGKDREIYHVGSPIETSIENLVGEIAAALGVNCAVQKGELTAGSTLRRCPDIQKISNLGFRPQISLRLGIQKTVEWYKREIERMNERIVA